MKVLQLLPALDGGGVEQGTLDIAAGLVNAGNRALVMSAGGRLVAPLLMGGGEHVPRDIGSKSVLTLRHVLPLRQLLLNEKIDILHLRSRLPAWIGWLAWQSLPEALRPRLVSTVHGFYSVNRYSAVMTRGERVICVSQAVRRYVLESYPDLVESNLKVIHRGVDRDRFPHGFRPDPAWLSDWNRQWPCPAGTRTLLLPGRITRLKGHLELLGLVKALQEQGIPVRGFIAGGEDPRRRRYARELRRAIVQQGLTQQVHLLGHREDLREIMAVSDLVLSLSSQPESFGRTTLEALSLGRPVLGFDHGGVGEILESLYPAGAVPAGDGGRLRSRARDLLQSAPTVPREHDFVLQGMVARTLELYQDLLSSPA